MGLRSHESADTSRIRVWDLPVRLFHWLLVVLIALLWYSGDVGGLDIDLTLPGDGSLYYGNMDVHMFLGQIVLVLVLFRILWGLAGSTTARFSSFVRGPSAVLGYIRTSLQGGMPLTAGHNPGGGWMVLVLLLLLAGQTVTGLFASDDLFSEGPLAHLVGSDTSGWLTEIHGILFNLLLAAIVLHVLAVLYYGVRGKNLVGPMVTGKKAAEMVPAEERTNLQQASLWLALLLLAGAGLAVWGLRWL